MAEVILDQVYKRFGNIDAVKDFNLHVADEEFMVFVGPSGCGKTTTLRMIAGLEEISDGTLRIGDRVVNDVPPKDRDIAMVFQNYALYPHMNVYQNMSFGLRLRRTAKSEIDRRVREAAKILQIEHLLDRRPRELSGGQRQRVALGRAIVREPKVFLMDEPLSNLDAKLRVEMRASITKLHRRLGVTTVYVTHDQVEAMTMGTRIVVMRDGLIQQVDTPINLYEKPVNKFVGGFMGSPAMNFLVGTVENGRIKGPSFNVAADTELTQKLQRHNGQKVHMGIRPESLGLRGQTSIAEKGEGDNAIRVQVEVVEPLGAETHVLASVGGDQTLVARIDAHADVKMGDQIDLLADINKIQAFDLETERNIRYE
ncbi:MAG: sn-glycerol-3-phosphate ABC transporter ATP-binding protein UgpC [Deinococcota bacterium]|nr:sn-glycerol-3-phosphate ABC transporter ATP-binding protein UgpC [Deinococcota bacterium]